MNPTFDLRINGGTLIDGSGVQGSAGDIGIRDGRVVAIGSFAGEATRTIDARGMTVAPGFIDIHTHYDAQVFWDRSLSPSSCHGVTTIVGGNCGFSIAPLNGTRENAEYLMRMLARVEGMPLEGLRQGVPWNWKSFEDYLQAIRGTLAINAAFMVGHSALRCAVMGARSVGDAATTEEIGAMQDLLRRSLAAGGLGFSTSIAATHNDGDGNPVPSRYARREEFLALAEVVGEFEGTSLEIAPDIGVEFTGEFVKLITDLSLAAKRPLNWNVLIPSWQMPKVYRSQIGATDYAAAHGAKVVPLAIVKPGRLWINFHGGFFLDSLPGWAETMRLEPEARKAALADPDVRSRLAAGARSPEAGTRVLMTQWSEWRIAQTVTPGNQALRGRSVGDVAREQGKAVFDALLDIVIADDLKTVFELPSRAEDDRSWSLRADLWRDERTVAGASDAGAHLDMIEGFASCTQVLAIGVRERNLLSLEEAVRQLTSVPAGLIGLRGRGLLKQGYWADIVVFDPDAVGPGTVHTRYDIPGGAGRIYSEATGISHVIVNGQEIFRERQFCGNYPGAILCSGKDTDTVSLPAVPA